MNDIVQFGGNCMASIFGRRRRGIGVITALLVASLLEAAPQAASAHDYEILYAFKAGTDGLWPSSGLVMDASGNLYGVTAYGGGSANCSGGCGTVFKLGTDGNETVLYRFSGKADGQYPLGIVRDDSGNIYGTTLWGGNPNCVGYGSCGVVYKLDAKGAFTVLHTFEGGSDGTNPEAALAIDSSGNLYGTTVAGGAGGGCTNQNPPGCGTIFEIVNTGQEMVLHAFSGSDGADPSAGLLLDASGNLYGSALEGGSYNFGTIFKLSTSGKLTVLHDFTGQAPDNGYPYDGLAWDGAGNLVGTTEWHPPGSNIFGTVFKLAIKTRTMTELFTFDLLDGGYPVAGLLRDPKGNLYGTTLSGGSCKSNGCGTVFEVGAAGNESTLHNFTVGRKGHAPQCILVRDKAGNLYGTALEGPYHAGIVFRVKP